MNKQLKIKLLNVLNADLKRSMEVDSREVTKEKAIDIHRLYKIIDIFDNPEFINLLDKFLYEKYEKEKWER